MKIDNKIEKSNTDKNLPQHVAIIMDGNRRWSAEHGVSQTAGHKQAIDRMEQVIEYAADLGITHLTFWAWSTKNWTRNREFISDILKLFRMQLEDEDFFQRTIRKGVKLHHVGKWDGFPKDIQKGVEAKLKVDPEKKAIDVNIALGYEGRDEIVRAVQKIINKGIPADQITKEIISEHMDTAGQPDVDLMIRTGGDQRTSGYLIWQSADAEFYFTDTYMPDFDVDAFQTALDSFSIRERRLGGDSKKY